MKMKDVYTELLMTRLPLELFSVDGIEIKGVWFGENVKSQLYGKIKCEFEKNSHSYKLTYNVHIPEEDEEFSNHPECVEKVIYYDEVIGNETFPAIKTKETSFGHKAFWSEIELEDLSGDDYVLRVLINTILEYSEENQLVQRLLKTDEEALRVNPIYKN